MLIADQNLAPRSGRLQCGAAATTLAFPFGEGGSPSGLTEEVSRLGRGWMGRFSRLIGGDYIHYRAEAAAAGFTSPVTRFQRSCFSVRWVGA